MKQLFLFLFIVGGTSTVSASLVHNDQLGNEIWKVFCDARTGRTVQMARLALNPDYKAGILKRAALVFGRVVFFELEENENVVMHALNKADFLAWLEEEVPVESKLGDSMEQLLKGEHFMALFVQGVVGETVSSD